MKIAVPVTVENKIDGHFGHCAFYHVHTLSESGDILETKCLESPQGCGCKSNIATVLADHGVTVMLAGGIGEGAINVLNNACISVIRGCTGFSTDVAKQYAAGTISDSGSTCSAHEHGHSCSH